MENNFVAGKGGLQISSLISSSCGLLTGLNKLDFSGIAVPLGNVKWEPLGFRRRNIQPNVRRKNNIHKSRRLLQNSCLFFQNSELC